MVKFFSENRMMSSLTSKCRSVNKHLETLFSYKSGLVKTQTVTGVSGSQDNSNFYTACTLVVMAYPEQV